MQIDENNIHEFKDNFAEMIKSRCFGQSSDMPNYLKISKIPS